MPTLTLTRPPETTAPEVTAPAPGPVSREALYRRDLDGLRGVAIALVAIFHVWFGRVSGGVDVFLALSGFFFGGSVLRTVLTPGTSLSPWPNIKRLARRLLPALVLVLAASAVLTVAIQPQTRWEAFADQTLASLGYYQNWELAATASNYLRAGEAVSPLQHIWSMSVQGQFYISFLLLIFGVAALLRRLLGSRRLRTVFVVLLTALTVASFVYAIIAHQADQVTAYYNSFARAWELLLGVLVGALVPLVTWPMWVRTLLATIALAAILSCGALIDGVKQFPGPWALVPVGAAMLLIMAGANRAGPAVHPGPAAGAQPAAGCSAAGDAGFDGVLALPVALAAADLLAGLHRRVARRIPRRSGDPAGVRGPGLPDDALRRGAAALSAGPGSTRCADSVLACVVAPPCRRRRHRRDAAGGGLDRDVVHLARTRGGAARQRQGTDRPDRRRVSRRAGPDRQRQGAPTAVPAHRAGGGGRRAGVHQRRLHQ